MNRLERNMLAFLFGVALAFVLFMPVVHAETYQTEVEVVVLTDYIRKEEFPQCSIAQGNNGAGLTNCICFQRTGNSANTQVTNTTRTLSTAFSATTPGAFSGENWTVRNHTCTADSSTVYTIGSTGACASGTSTWVTGAHSPVDLKCKSVADFVADWMTDQSITTGGDIDMTEMIDAMNLNAEQVATLILYCCVAVAFILGVKTGLMR